MGQSIQNFCIGLMIGLMLAGCQQKAPIEPNLTPNIPTRAIEHAMGTSQVPIAPERVVVLDTTPLDAAIALEIQPVGTIRYGDLPQYLGTGVNEIEVIGEYNQPNLETIVRLNPDLILGAKSISARLYSKLSRIAPTVFIEGAGYSWDWKNNFRLFAEAMGRADKAELLLADYQQQLVDLSSLVDQLSKPIKVSILSSTTTGLIAQTPTGFAGSILKEVGLERNEIQSTEKQSFIKFSREDLEGADGDVIFLVYNPAWDDDSKSEFIEDPLWSKLKAVQQNAVCEVEGDIWASGRSILAANKILEDIEACLEEVL